MADIQKHRRSLWLRSERALGVRSVRRPAGDQLIAPDDVPPMDIRPAAGTLRGAIARPAPVAPAITEAEPTLIPDATSIFDEPLTAPVLPTEQKRAALIQMEQAEVSVCKLCRLCEARTRTVFGEGDADAALMFIGEGPGEQEDQSGRPFVGRAGQKLDEMIGAMGLKREQVYIANIVKCRPPRNREPVPDETASCTPYLVRQIEIVRPRVIVTLGRPASQYLLRTKIAMGKLRGEWHQWRGIQVMPTFHPAYILRNYTPEVRRAVWSDLQQVMRALDLGGAATRA